MTADILQKLPADLFNPVRLPKRDEYGYVSHPDADLIFELLGVDDEGEAAWKYIVGLGYDHCAVALDDDDLLEEYAIDLGCTDWEPEKPEGDGWVLAWITDSEDGPVAVYLRKLPS
jgi:hypothetical protein